MTTMKQEILEEVEKHVEKQEYDEAYNKMHILLMASPKSATYLGTMIRICCKCGYWTKVIAYAKNKKGWRIDDTMTDYYLGKANFRIGLYDKAIEYLRPIQSLDAKSEKIKLMLDESLKKLSERVKAPQEEESRSCSSSMPRKEPVNWDKLVEEFEKEEESQLTGEAALNNFFRSLYDKADDDTKRAMTKSFQESSGTVLSTNWENVAKAEVKPRPPEGVDMKKL